MRKLHDLLCKHLLREALDPLSTVELEKPVAPLDEQRIDVYCELRSELPPPEALNELHEVWTRLVLRTPDRAELQQLDQALWSFSEQDFLPHVMAGDPLAAQTPIILTADDSTDLPHHQILINLGSDTPAHFARFERLLEIISADDADKAAGRDRYRFYKERGYPLSHHVAA